MPNLPYIMILKAKHGKNTLEFSMFTLYIITTLKIGERDNENKKKFRPGPPSLCG